MDKEQSPFFRPSNPHHRRPARASAPKAEAVEAKSSIGGCAANLANAIVGSGVVGIAFAVRQAGLWMGVVLVILCALLTDQSLRLLMSTAKHAHTATYERVAEAAFGTAGFRFVALNMFLMAAGAMVSYLMIVKDTLPVVLGLTDAARQRAVLFLLSIGIILPLSCQRDMARLAKTSSVSVLLDTILVAIVAWQAPWKTRIAEYGWQDVFVHDVAHWDTLFMGLGVLSFAFVCQHSAFLIAGSLDNPTTSRWAQVTKRAVTFCGLLALASGIFGYVGYGDQTTGNILNNLPLNGPANMARLLLGTTMLLVYPMESFVARHVIISLFFQGSSAHEGNDDSVILQRADRRVLLTSALWAAAFVTAVLANSLGSVLAVTGAIGGSSLSYIGPGMVYLGVHGEAFLELVRESKWFGPWFRTYWSKEASDEKENAKPLNESTPLVAGIKPVETGEAKDEDDQNAIGTILSVIVSLLTLMPIWCFLASAGRDQLHTHMIEMATKSPIPLRIGNVEYSRSLDPRKKILNAFGAGLPPVIVRTPVLEKRRAKEANIAREPDPQANPTWYDFVKAMLFCLFGVLALVAGLWSCFFSG